MLELHFLGLNDIIILGNLKNDAFEKKLEITMISCLTWHKPTYMKTNQFFSLKWMQLLKCNSQNDFYLPNFETLGHTFILSKLFCSLLPQIVISFLCN